MQLNNGLVTLAVTVDAQMEAGSDKCISVNKNLIDLNRTIQIRPQ